MQLLNKLFRRERRSKKAAVEFAVPPACEGTEAGRLMHEALAAWREQRTLDAMRAAQKAVRAGATAPGLNYFLGRCLLVVGRHEEAQVAFAAELKVNPGHADAARLQARFAEAWARPASADTGARSWHTSLAPETLQSIQSSLHHYTYRGVPLLKNPFDLALYPMLLWEVKPRTIFEIGSKSGGSGLWLGDLLNSFGIEGHIHSVDIVRVDAVSHPRVTFIEGDGRNLAQTFTPAQLEQFPRPWLIIEDADHEYETSIAVLRFFHPWLRPGEFIIVEDGIISDLTQDETCMSGPHRALKEFLPAHETEYVIDAGWCDFFGPNLTWSTNGFLRKISPGERVPVPAALVEIERLFAGGDLRTAFEKLNALKAGRVPMRGVDFWRGQYFLEKKQTPAAVEAFKEELRFFPDHAGAQAALQRLVAADAAAPLPGDAEFQELYQQIRNYTMLSPARLWSLFSHARELCQRDVPGNFVECGVAAGGSSALLATVIARHSKSPRRLFSCDTFEGMPEASEHDTHKGKHAESTGWGTGTCAAPMDSLKEICRKLGVENLVEPVQGLFADTLPANRERFGELALLHMDGDWYSSTRDILVNLYDRVAAGGFVQIDDYGYWEGCRRAVSEFERERRLKFQLHTIDETGVWMAK